MKVSGTFESATAERNTLGIKTATTRKAGMQEWVQSVFSLFPAFLILGN
jgi:hypothetical protein